MAKPVIRVAADLCRKTTWIEAQTRNHRVFDLLEGDLSLLNIPVIEDGKIVGLINRDSFMRRMARRFHWELYSQKRCTKMMDPHPIVVDADTPVRDLAGSLLDRDKPERISEGFVVMRDGQLVGTGLTSDVIAAILLLEQQASHELRQHRDLLSQLVDERTRALEDARRNQAKQHAEVELAKGIIERLTRRHDADDGRGAYEACVQQWLQPAEHFSGDSIAATCTSSGCLYVLLADATGHGLTAAITIVPVLTLFYRMTEENQPIEAIVAALNQEVKDTMPVGRFVAASLLVFDPAAGQVALWHGGMPDVLHLDATGQILHTYRARQPPLGILDSDALLSQAEYLPVGVGDYLVLYSDGLPEAENAAGDFFGQQRILDALQADRGNDCVGSLRRALEAHLQGKPPHDDISLVAIRCVADACVSG